MDNWEHNLLALQGAPLFAGFGRKELLALLRLLRPALRRCARGEVLLAAGTRDGNIGVVLAGRIEAAKLTRAGGQLLVQRMGPGGVYGDVLSAGASLSPVTVSAATACRVLLLPFARLLAPPAGGEELCRRLLTNLVGEISGKFFALDSRIDLLLIRGLRRRLAAYLLDASRGEQSFTIPYNRSQLAAFLGCERSAVSRELSRMAAEGLIETQGRRFTLPAPAALRALHLSLRT